MMWKVSPWGISTGWSPEDWRGGGSPPDVGLQQLTDTKAMCASCTVVPGVQSGLQALEMCCQV